MNNIAERFGSIILFIIYAWFGALKLLKYIPPSALDRIIYAKTIAAITPALSFQVFFILFALLELIIGIMFLIPRFRTAAIILLVIHVIIASLPLVFAAGMWQSAFVPSFEAQYLIKNLAIISVALFLWQTRKWA